MKEASLCQRLDRRSGRVAARSDKHRREGVRPRRRRWPACGRPEDRRPRCHGSPATPPPGTLGPSYARVPLARVQETGRFELAGLRGPMVLFAEGAGGPSIDSAVAGRSSPGRRWMFGGTERFDDVVVELTKRVAHVDVNVTSASERGEPEPVMVILFSGGSEAVASSVHSRYDRTNALPVSAGETLRPARTRMTRLPPGQYPDSGNPRRWPQRSGGGGRVRHPSPARGAGHACRG